jgi:hypothetical protein
MYSDTDSDMDHMDSHHYKTIIIKKYGNKYCNYYEDTSKFTFNQFISLYNTLVNDKNNYLEFCKNQHLNFITSLVKTIDIFDNEENIINIKNTNALLHEGYNITEILTENEINCRNRIQRRINSNIQSLCEIKNNYLINNIKLTQEFYNIKFNSNDFEKFEECRSTINSVFLRIIDKAFTKCFQNQSFIQIINKQYDEYDNYNFVFEVIYKLFVKIRINKYAKKILGLLYFCPGAQTQINNKKVLINYINDKLYILKETATSYIKYINC